MNKSLVTKLMFACIIVLVVLGMTNVMTAGTKHVEVITTNHQLKEENGKLKEQNDVLRTTSLAVAEEVGIADSLVRDLAQKDSTLKSVQQSMTQIKQQLEHEKRNSITSTYNTTPYKLEPIEIPSSEDN